MSSTVRTTSAVGANASARGVDRLPGWSIPAAAFALSVLTQFTRRPDLFERPQFFAEDGSFFAHAHNLGAFSGWFEQSNGYLQLLPRIVSAVAQAVPLSSAPLFVLAVAVAVNALPPTLLMSSRLRQACPSLASRALLALLYMGLPGANHAASVLVYSQWHLALAAFLVLVATAPRTRLGSVFDAVLVIISGLSGPYSILLAPVAVVHWYLRPSVRSGLLAAAVAMTGIVQAVTMATVGRAMRSSAPHGASVFRLFRIVGGRLVYGATVGHTAQAIVLPAWPRTLGSDWTIAFAGLAGIVLLAVAFWRGTHELRMMILFGGAIVAAVLANASVSPEGPPQWVVLQNQDALPTYFIIPIVAFYAAVVWMVAQPSWMWRAPALAILLTTCAFGIRRDWRELPVEDEDFAASVREYESAPPGATVVIPIPPQSWSIVLAKPAGPP